MKARLRLFAVALLVGGAVGLGGLWFTMFSPWGYAPPSGLPAIEANVPQRVFVYGTLRNVFVRWGVIGRHVPTEAAQLPGYRKQGLDLRAQSGASVDGEVFVVDAEQLRRLDRYERLGVRYERIERALQDGTVAWVYRRIVQREAGAVREDTTEDETEDET